jgi:hypothetical protein
MNTLRRKMMQYLLMIYQAENAGPTPGTEEFGTMTQGYFQFNQEMEERGLMVGGNPLEPISTASTVRLRDNKSAITDGPFAETKEVLGGYYLLDCKDLDEALECAAKIPTAKWGSIEVRPIMDLSKFQPD